MKNACNIVIILPELVIGAVFVVSVTSVAGCLLHVWFGTNKNKNNKIPLYRKWYMCILTSLYYTTYSILPMHVVLQEWKSDKKRINITANCIEIHVK